MNARKHRRAIAAGLGLAGITGVVLPLAGTASADEDPTTGYPSTQNPAQGLIAGLATADNLRMSFLDAVNGDDRPDGANGTETKFPQLDPRFVEGPLGGLAKNGPLR